MITNIKKSIAITFAATSIWGCSMNSEMIEPTSSKTTDLAVTKSVSTYTTTQAIKDQVIIQFTDPNMTSETKYQLREKYKLEYRFDIIDIETCDCDNDNLELWTIQALPGFLGVENLVTNLPGQTSDDDVDGDLMHRIVILNNSANLNSHINTISDKVVPENSNDAITVAILDTGVDYDYFPGRFLYNSNADMNCENEISGWDFVNKDNDPRDDHGHGTYVAHIITKRLAYLGIPYQILPIKAFDKNGRGNYWSVLCALNYLSKKPGKFVVNMSFGYYDFPNQTILKRTMDSMRDNALLISSAGNEGLDTDRSGSEHFPSGFDSDNMVTVGGCINDPLVYPHIDPYGNVYGLIKSPDSNYGRQSIDVMAHFDQYNIELVATDSSHIIYDTIKGTSFSNAYVTARAAELMYQGVITPVLLKDAVIRSGYRSSATSTYTRTGRIILHEVSNGSGPVLHN